MWGEFYTKKYHERIYWKRISTIKKAVVGITLVLGICMTNIQDTFAQTKDCKISIKWKAKVLHYEVNDKVATAEVKIYGESYILIYTPEEENITITEKDAYTYIIKRSDDFFENKVEVIYPNKEYIYVVKVRVENTKTKWVIIQEPSNEETSEWKKILCEQNSLLEVMEYIENREKE